MSFLKQRIREQAFLEAEIDIDKVIEENGITDETVVFKMEFSKEVFAEEKEVREYLQDKYVYGYKITETDSLFIVKMLSEAQVEREKEIKLEVRRGVVAYAGELQVMALYEEISFSEKGDEVNLASDLFRNETLNFSDGLPYIIEIARVAEGEHPSYGVVKITKETLQSMERNFKAKVTGVDLAVNEDHKKNEAFGWFKDVFLSHDEEVLYGQVIWNAKGTRSLSEKEYRYFSPEFRFNYVHPHSGKEYGPTLMGGALTNYPFLKMEAITELNQKQEVKKMSTQTVELSVHETKMVELNSKLNSVQLELNAKAKEVIDLSEANKKLEGEIAQMKKEKVHQKLFDEGKINAAQLVALNEGKGTAEVLALASTVNQTPKGGTTVQTTVELSEGEKEMAKKLHLTEEEYIEFSK